MTTYFYSIFLLSLANFHLCFFFKPDRNTEKGFSPMLASPATLALPLRSIPEVNKIFFVIGITIIQVNIAQLNSRGLAFLGVWEFESRIILILLI